MPMSHESGLVVISGASTGLGAATARALADAGFHVLAGVRREEDGADVRGARVEPVLLDVTNAQHLSDIAEKVRGTGMALRAVINNAGLPATAPVETMPLETWRSVFDVNVFGLVGLTQALLPLLHESKGRVVNISSIGGKVATPGSGAYSGSKFAVEAISDALRQELAPHGVQVVVVEPGGMRTGMGARGKSAAEEQLALMTPQQRDRYRPLMTALLAYVDTFDTHGMDPEDAAKTVVRATTDPRPRARYTIGRQAAALSKVSRILPTRALDRMVASSLKS